ncbi:MAG: DedA family protein [Deltaproteobacteria bacterium HGW-Deltaproteobacteria-14]|nr:MAG: DedA family protein [Deltaproteobacteria bacterium HGW-Deltaproteobacteria-14]
MKAMSCNLPPRSRSDERRLSPAARRWVRLGLLVALLGGLAAVGVATGLTRDLSVESLRGWMVGAGALGVIGFLAAFALGTLVQVPGMLFVAAAALAWGQIGGAIVAIAGALLAVTVSFLLVRAVGGRLLTEIRRPFLERLLARLDGAPIRTVAVLRLVFWVAPPLNYALAFSNVPLRAYVIGSAVGLLAPIVIATSFVDLLL